MNRLGRFGALLRLARENVRMIPQVEGQVRLKIDWIDFRLRVRGIVSMLI